MGFSYSLNVEVTGAARLYRAASGCQKGKAMNIITSEIALAKNGFAVHGVKENGKAELAKPR